MDAEEFEKDLNRYDELLKESKEAAQTYIGLCYVRWKNSSDSNSPYQGFEWLHKIAERGYADAQTKLGICYLEGFGVQKDKAKAIKLFLKAAEQGNEEAQKELEKIYISQEK